MRRYELMVIVTDTLDDDGAEAALQRIRDLIDSTDGRRLDESFWGKRELTFEINHRRYGYYAIFDFEVELTGMKEIERRLVLDDDIVRYKTIRPDLRVRRPV